MPRLTKEVRGFKEILQQRKMAKAALEFDDFQQALVKKHKLSMREMYDLARGSADIYLMEMLKRVK